MARKKDKGFPYTTDAGYDIMIRGISPLMQAELAARREEPEAPFVTITTDLGDTEKIPLTPERIEREEDPDYQAELQAQWDSYQERVQEANSAYNLLMVDVYLEDGIEVELPEDMGPWTRKMKRRGLEVPEDPDELRLAFIKREVIGSANDMNVISEQVAMRSANIDEGRMKRLERMFRTQVEGEGTVDAAAAEKPVGHAVDGAGDAGGEGVGHRTAEPVL